MQKFINRIFLSIIYVIGITILITLPYNLFRDRDSYTYYAGFYDQLIKYYLSKGYLEFFINEPLFLYINKLLGYLLDPKQTVIFFTCFTFSVFFWLLCNISKNFVTFVIGLLLYFTITYTFHLQFVTLRQSLATSILLLTLFYCKKNSTLLLVCFILGFIHSSFFFVFALFCVNILLNKIIKKDSIVLMWQAIIYSLVGIVSLTVANIIGFRQSEALGESDVIVGGGSWILWLAVTLYMVYFGDRKHEKIYNYAMIGLVAFISLYFTTPFIGRLFSSFIPAFILVLSSRFRSVDLIIATILLLAYTYLILNGILYNLSFTYQIYYYL